MHVEYLMCNIQKNVFPIPQLFSNVKQIVSGGYIDDILNKLTNEIDEPPKMMLLRKVADAENERNHPKYSSEVPHQKLTELQKKINNIDEAPKMILARKPTVTENESDRPKYTSEVPHKKLAELDQKLNEMEQNGTCTKIQHNNFPLFK